MSKKNRTAKNKSRTKDRQGFKVMTSPYDGMTEEEIKELLISVSKNSANGFEENLQQLFNELAKVDPILLLSSFAFYGLTYDGITSEWDRPINVTQHNVELLHALLITKDRSNYTFYPIIGDTFPKVLDYLWKLSLEFQWKRLEHVALLPTLSDRQKFSIQEYMRTHTQVARNWGYPDQIQRTVIKLFQPLDDAIEAYFGVRTEYLVNMCFKIIETVEDRINQHRQYLRSIFRIRKVNGMVKRYAHIFLDNDNGNDLISFFKENNFKLQQVKSYLLAHSDLFLSELFTFSSDNFIEAYGAPVKADDLKTILDKWTLHFGDLQNSNVEHFFMSNPVWDKPLITTNDGLIFIPIVGLFISFCLEIMENIVRDQKEIWNKYLERRSSFLETELRELFNSAFPDAQIYTGSQWSDPKDSSIKYENDLLILFDTTAFVIEAKSGKVRQQTRRGAPSTLQDDTEKLITDAAIQANRLIEFLEEYPGYTFQTRRGATNIVNVSHIENFQPMSITLDFLGAVSAHVPSLQRAGLVSTNVKSIPTVSLPELETVFDILTEPVQKVHYFAWRTQLEQNTEYTADEIDLLAVYVTDQFMEATVLGNEASLYFYGESDLFNPYYLKQYHQQDIPKPVRQFTTWWRHILHRIEQIKSHGWTKLSRILLDLSYAEQEGLEKHFRKIVIESQKSKTDVYAYAAHSTSKHSIIIFGYKSEIRENRKSYAGDIAAEIMEEHSTIQALIIGIDIDREKDDYPYSFLGLSYPGSTA